MLVISPAGSCTMLVPFPGLTRLTVAGSIKSPVISFAVTSTTTGVLIGFPIDKSGDVIGA